MAEITPKKTQTGERTVKANKKYQKTKVVLDDISSSDSDIDLLLNVTGAKFKNCLSDSDIDLDFENDQINELLDDEKMLKDDYVLVKFVTKKLILHYVGKVIEVLENEEFEVRFLKKCTQGFIFPQVADISSVERKDVVSKLTKPTTTPGTSRMASYIQFNISFFCYNAQ